MADPRILLWDIETSNLSASFGSILCVGYKWLGEPLSSTTVMSVQDVNGYCKKCDSIIRAGDDRALLEKVAPILSEADAWVTWYGTYFDVPYVNSRLLLHQQPPLPPVFHIDGWKTARYKMHIGSNALKSVQHFLGLREAKTAIKPAYWVQAVSGDAPSLAYITKHCAQDVKVLEQAYERLKPLLPSHPNINLFRTTEGCPTCGSRQVQKRGFHFTPTSRYQRYQCMACGAWHKGALVGRSKVKAL